MIRGACIGVILAGVVALGALAHAAEVKNAPVAVKVAPDPGGSTINIIVNPPSDAPQAVAQPQYVSDAIAITQSAVSYIEIMLTILGLIIALAVAFGVWEIRKLKKTYERILADIEERARCSAGTIETLKGKAEKDSSEITRIREDLDNLTKDASTTSLQNKKPTKDKLFHKLENKVAELKRAGGGTSADDDFLIAAKCFFDNDNDEAITWIDKAIVKAPQYPFYFLFKGSILAKNNVHKDAIDEFDKAIKLKPDFIEAYNNKGVSLIKLGQYEKALEELRKAIIHKNDFSDAYYNLACTYALMGNRENSLKDLETAIRLDDKHKQMAREDKDLASLREDEEFKRLTS